MPENNNLNDEITFSQIQGFQLENVCYQLTTRGKWPFKSHFNSTSFFIDNNYLLTSAHNVVKTYRNVNKMNIAPARVGESYHFGQFSFNTSNSKNFRIFPDYDMLNKTTRMQYDIAIVYIPQETLDQNPNFIFQNSLPILEDSSSLQIGEEVYCAGYPAAEQHEGRFRMTLDKSEILDIEEHSFTHNLNTVTGNSGSPIMVKRNNQFYVIGINSIEYNGTLINEIKRNWIQEAILSF